MIGTDNASFTIAGILLKAATVFNKMVKSSYSISLRVTDLAGSNFEKTFVIAIS